MTVNLVALPTGSTYLYTGFNDIGGPSSTVNFAAMQHLARTSRSAAASSTPDSVHAPCTHPRSAAGSLRRAHLRPAHPTTDA